MTSCSNEEADDVMAPRPQYNNQKSSEEADNVVYFFACDDQLQYLNNYYTVAADGQTFEVCLNTVVQTDKLSSTAEFMMEGNFMTFGRDFFHAYSYKLPAGIRGDVKVTAHFTIKEGVTLPDYLSIVSGSVTGNNNCIKVSQNEPATMVQASLEGNTRAVVF